MQITFPAEQIKGHFKNFSGNFPQNATIKPIIRIETFVYKLISFFGFGRQFWQSRKVQQNRTTSDGKLASFRWPRKSSCNIEKTKLRL